MERIPLCRVAGGRAPKAVLPCRAATEVSRSPTQASSPAGFRAAVPPHLSVPYLSAFQFSQVSDSTALPYLSVTHRQLVEAQDRRTGPQEPDPLISLTSPGNCVARTEGRGGGRYLQAFPVRPDAVLDAPRIARNRSLSNPAQGTRSTVRRAPNRRTGFQQDASGHGEPRSPDRAPVCRRSVCLVCCVEAPVCLKFWRRCPESA